MISNMTIPMKKTVKPMISEKYNLACMGLHHVVFIQFWISDPLQNSFEVIQKKFLGIFPNFCFLMGSPLKKMQFWQNLGKGLHRVVFIQFWISAHYRLLLTLSRLGFWDFSKFLFFNGVSFEKNEILAKSCKGAPPRHFYPILDIRPIIDFF